MQITHKFRLYPSKKQEEKLLWTLEKCRFTYNLLLENLNKQDKPDRLKLQSMLPSLKNKYPELKNVYSKVLQYECYKLFSNLKALSRLKKNGKKIGKLRFKSKNRLKTFVYNQFGFKLIKTGKRLNKLHLSKIGDIPIRQHREINGKIKQIIIKRYSSGKWYAMLCVEKQTHKQKPKSNKAIGIDVGIKHFLTDSDGRQIENPKIYEKLLDRIRLEQRKLSRKQKGSKNYEKQRIRLARYYEKLVNKRDDFLHKLSRFYADNYGRICVENLNIRGMVRNRNLARMILDASWGKFIQLLSYKAGSAGGVVIKVNPKGTSKEYKYGKLDRDYNASLNILERGLSGQGLSFEPVETRPLREIPASLVIEAGSPILSG